MTPTMSKWCATNCANCPYASDLRVKRVKYFSAPNAGGKPACYAFTWTGSKEVKLFKRALEVATYNQPISLEKKLEAAPRFELGVKVLQTLALPLGYAAAAFFADEVYRRMFIQILSTRMKPVS